MIQELISNFRDAEDLDDPLCRDARAWLQTYAGEKGDNMKPGTIVKLPDGRIGTVVYHGLDGYGIRWGRQSLDPDVVRLIYEANPLFDRDRPGYEWAPEAMLRDLYKSAQIPCVGSDYEILPEEP